jgi:two-component system cell cycle sensor histidine kinase/response regulator CckA
MRKRRAEVAAVTAARETHRPSVAELEHLFELSLDLLCVAGFDGRFKRLNPAFERTLGYTLDELLADPLVELVHEDDREATVAELDRIAHGNEAWFENRYRCKDGSYRWLQWKAAPALEEGLFYAAARDVTERKRAEQFLQQSEERFEAFMDNSPAITVIKDSDGRYVYVSSRWLKTLGFTSPDQVLGKTSRDLFPPDISAHYEADDRAALAGHEVTESIEPRLLADGSRGYGLGYKFAIPDTDGRPLVASVSVDISERIRAEEALRESEERFQAFMDNSPAIAMMKDAEGRYVYVSGPWLEEYGLARDEVLGKTPFELFPADIAEHYRGHEREVLATGQAIRSVEPRLRKDGTRGWAIAYKFPVDAAGQRLVGGVGVDITDWKQAEEELREAETRYRTLVEQLPLALYLDTLDERSSKSYRSPQIERMLGYSVEEWDEDPGLFARLLHPDDCGRVLAVHARTRATGEPLSSEYRLIARDGRTVWCKDEARVVRDSDGKPLWLQGYLLDVTEQKRAQDEHERLETELRYAQKMEALGRLAGGVAHDFNNLLTAITGYGEVLLGELPVGGGLHRAAEEIKRAADRAGLMTRQLLTFSRRQLVQRRVVDLNEAVASTAPMLQRLIGEDVAFATRVETGPLLVEIDPGQLEQVIVNLVVNARDAMPRGGSLTVSTRRLDVAEGRVGHPALPPGRYASLAVSDEGAGMDEQTRARIFEPFFTTKEIGEGTGLGLAIVYGIVQESGGQVDVQSEPGHGSTFAIFLPSADQSAQVEPEPRDQSKPARGGSGTVLLVEDEPLVRDLVARTLRRQGYDVLEASDGVEALEVADSCAELELVVTDLVMPRMSGYELAERLRSSRPAASVIVMSGYAGEGAVPNRSVPEGAVLLEKPFTPSVLLQSIERALAATRESL